MPGCSEIVAMTTAQAAALTSGQVAGLTSDQIAKLETDDLRAMSTGAIRALCAALADPDVGSVSGNLVLEGTAAELLERRDLLEASYLGGEIHE